MAAVFSLIISDDITTIAMMAAVFIGSVFVLYWPLQDDLDDICNRYAESLVLFAIIAITRA